MAPTCLDKWDIDCAANATAGYCTHPNTTDQMMADCKKSCNVCGDYICKDNEEDAAFCPEWAENGDCNDWFYGDYMMQNCRASCNACDGCTDNINYAAKCPGWANEDQYCNHKYHEDFMMKNCRASCNACKSTNITTPIDRYA